MSDLKKHLQIIRALHKRDLNQYENLSMLMDMVLTVKDEDIELAMDEAQFVKKKLQRPVPEVRQRCPCL